MPGRFARKNQVEFSIVEPETAWQPKMLYAVAAELFVGIDQCLTVFADYFATDVEKTLFFRLKMVKIAVNRHGYAS